MSRRPLRGEPLPVASRCHPLALLVCACFWELVLLLSPSEGAAQSHFPHPSPAGASILQPADPELDGFSASGAGAGANLAMTGQGGMPAEAAAETSAEAAFDHAALVAGAGPGGPGGSGVPDEPGTPAAPSAVRFSLTQSTGVTAPTTDKPAASESAGKAIGADSSDAPPHEPSDAALGGPRDTGEALQDTAAAVSAELPASADVGAEEPGARLEEPIGAPENRASEVHENREVSEARERFEDRTLERTGRRTMPDIIMHYPVFGMAQVDRDIEAWVEYLALAFERDLAGEPADGPEAYNVAWLNAICTVRFASPVCVSIVFDVWMHTGGTELSQDVLTLNYNLLTGQRLHIVDIFENVDTALRLLSEVARRELAKGAGQLDLAGVPASGFLMSDIALSDIENGTFPVPENFSSLAITEKGITVNFQPYQVWRLPKAVSVEVPLEELLPAGPLLTLWGKK